MSTLGRSAQQVIGELLREARGDRPMTAIARSHPMIPPENFRAAEKGDLKFKGQRSSLEAVIDAYRLDNKAKRQVAVLLQSSIWYDKPRMVESERVPFRMDMPHGAHRARL